jgi:hypothetical protein
MKTSRHISTNILNKNSKHITKTETKILDIKTPVAIQMALQVTPA